MEELIASQVELYGRISRTWDNLKKAGQQNVTIDLVHSTLSLLDNKWTRFEDQHATLMRSHRAALKDHEYVTGGYLAKAEIQYMSQRAQLLRLERQHAAVSGAEPAKPAASDQAAPAQPAAAHASSFPRIELPKFTGQFEDWPAFRDLFQSMVIEETTLTNVRKLHYLKTSVSGEAESLLKNLPTTDDNFERGWTALKERYENKRLLVRSYLNAFTALPKMRSNSMADLRQIYNGMMTTASALAGIGRPITANEDLFVHLVVNLLDQSTRREWDKTLRKSSDPPSLEELQLFLKEQVTSEEALEASRNETFSKTPLRSGRVVRTALQRAKQSNPGRACPIRSGAHFIVVCDQYLKKEPQGRKELVSTHNRCFNCLGRHSVSTCTTSKTCLKCSGRHHTSLHDAFSPAPLVNNGAASIHVAEQSSSEHAAVLLATARARITDSVGREHPVRALVDPGSETSLIAESLAQRLRLPRTPTSVAIFGIGGHQSGVARGRVTLTLAARDSSYMLTISSLVLPRLSAYSGATATGRSTWPHVQGLRLADPDFLSQDPVELLLGADVYATILMGGLRRGSTQEPVAQQTRLGWILLGGSTAGQPGLAVTSLHCSYDGDLSAALRRFWEWEEPLSVALPATDEERQGEKHFCDTHKRLSNGRFQVRLPFRIPPSPQLAFTRRTAERMLDTMKRRFARDDSFRRQYHEFMKEYCELQHMSLAPQGPPSEEGRLL